MKCPFKKITKHVHGNTSSTQPTHEVIEDFGECDEEKCMAYSKNVKHCIKLILDGN